MQRNNNNSNQIKFDEELSNVLNRYCSDSLVKRIKSDREEIALVEEKMYRSSEGQDEGSNGHADADLIFGFHLDSIIARCEAEVSYPEYLELLTDIGSLCKRFGKFEKAKDIYSRAFLSLNGEARYAKHMGTALLRRAEIYIRQADWESALDDLEQCRQIFHEANFDEGIGYVENSLGNMYAEQGDLKKAIDHWNNAHARFENVNDEMTAAVLMSLGIASNIRGEWSEALRYYQRALPIFEQIGSMSRLAELHHNLGMTFLSKGDIETAINQFNDSLSYSNQQYYQSVIGLSYLGKASAYARKGDYSISMYFVQKALDIFRNINDHLSIADAYKIKGIIHREMGNVEIAKVYLETSVRLNELYLCSLGLAEALYEVGLLCKERSETEAAKEAFQKSLQNFQKIGAQHNEQVVKEVMVSLEN